jgi:hypothetical protein
VIEALFVVALLDAVVPSARDGPASSIGAR